MSNAIAAGWSSTMNVGSSLTERLAGSGVNYAPQIVSAAQRHGLDPALLAAVAAQETGGPGRNGGSNVVGDGGHGRGLFQIDDRWHDFARSPAAMDPAKNADYAAGLLSGLLKRYGGDARKALSAYNAGSPDAAGTPTRWGDGRTLGYADSVLRHYASITGHAEDARAEQAQTAGNVNGLTLLAQLLQRGTALPPMPSPSSCSSQRPGLDATGHSQSQSGLAAYIDGDEA